MFSRSFHFLKTDESMYCKRYKLACAPIKDTDQPAHPCSLIIVFHGCSIDRQGPNIYSGSNFRWSRLCECADQFESALYEHADLDLMLASSSDILVTCFIVI